MAGTEPQSDESMEDILQSIKRIIEDDAGDVDRPAARVADEPEDVPIVAPLPPPATPTPPAPSPPVVAAESEHDVLELTEVVEVEGVPSPKIPTPKISTPAPTHDIIQSIDKMFAEEEPAEIPENTPAEPVRPPAAVPVSKPKVMEDGLVSDQAAKAAAAALKPIVEGAHKDRSASHIPSPGLRNGNTVEDLLLETLRPMLKAWLDEHLPTIVQKIVEKEVKRIVTFHQD